MKGVIIKSVLLLLGLSLLCGAIYCAAKDNPPGEQKIRILFSDGEAIVELFDNPMAREFLARLTMEAEFEDFSRTEKIFYLPEKLDTRGGEDADQKKADFCYYAPWGNIAVFYKGYGHGSSLYALGRLLSGKDSIASQKNSFKARLEAIN